MARRPLARDLIILIPGMLGSVLQRNGRDVWALSGRALLSALTRSFFEQLHLADDDWTQDDLDDGIVATRLLDDIISIPGLFQGRGYSRIRRSIFDTFGCVEGSIAAPQDSANFYPFPYDWRRDMRVAARRLQRFVEVQLPRWRAYSGSRDAQVILVADSVGGLVGRCYTELLGGWRDCRGLITCGTPWRGTIEALNVLSNGLRFFVFHNELTLQLRSFTMTYQMVPTYQVIQLNGAWLRPTEVESIPNIDSKRVWEAFALHNEIQSAAQRNAGDPTYRHVIIPWVGIGQPTHQSVLLEDGRLIPSTQLPDGIDPSFNDGDGSVPRLSALPPGTPTSTVRYVADHHGGLISNQSLLSQICATMADLMSDAATVGESLSKTVPVPVVGMSIRVEPYIAEGELVEVYIGLSEPASEPIGVEVVLTGDNSSQRPAQTALVSPGAGAIVRYADLPVGHYELEVRPLSRRSDQPTPVHGAFDILAAELLAGVAAERAPDAAAPPGAPGHPALDRIASVRSGLATLHADALRQGKETLAEDIEAVIATLAAAASAGERGRAGRVEQKLRYAADDLQALAAEDIMFRDLADEVRRTVNEAMRYV